MERYPVMFEAMREALVSDTWKKNVRFVGYGAFGPSHFGRWPQWMEYSLITDEWTSPDWHIWDGGSPSYYTHNWCDIRDHWVWSTQVESMNWIFQLDEAWQVKPDFWWEISLWDGNGGWTPGEDARRSRSRNRKPASTCGTARRTRPSGSRAGPSSGCGCCGPGWCASSAASTEPLEPWRPFFEQLLAAVDRVHAERDAREFWRHGELVPNRAHPHPFQEDVPEKYRQLDRWFLLDTNLDAPRPWTMTTNLPVFSMALVQGGAGTRRWLVYAHSPLEDRQQVTLTLPGYGPLTVAVPRAGAFYLVEEASRKVQPLR